MRIRSRDLEAARSRARFEALPPIEQQRIKVHFILSCATAAKQLNDMINLRDRGATVTPQAREVMDYIAGIIDQQHVKLFGVQFGRAAVDDVDGGSFTRTPDPEMRLG